MSNQSDTEGDKKWSYQFGLYRARVDAKTEEFLRMSRRRQMRHGCACAAAASALTVSVVVVLLIAYEYSVALHSSIVTNKFNQKRLGNNHTSRNNDKPMTEKLNRRNFIMDQESFERMPLMINALQENSNLDPTAEQYFTSDFSNQNIEKGKSLKVWNYIRKTSPRPFIFEYKSPTPSPFKKSSHYSSRTWLDNYRNKQRVKNLEHIINYLQKTVHAKVADMIPSSSNRLVTFSGAFIQPTPQLEVEPTPADTDAASQQASSDVSGEAVTDHTSHSDLFYKYKPDSPGDINMLADEMLRFSPILNPLPVQHNTKTLVPLFRPIKYPPSNICYGISCPIQGFAPKTIYKTPKYENNEYHFMPSQNKSKVLSLMLDIFPIDNRNPQMTTSRLHKVSKLLPLQRTNYQFRHKPSVNIIYNRPRPTVIPIGMTPHFHRFSESKKIAEQVNSDVNLMSKESNIYPKAKIINNESKNKQRQHTSMPLSIASLDISEGQVIAATEALSTQSPIHEVTTALSMSALYFNLTNINPLDRMYNLIEQASRATDAPVPWTTNPPELLKFSHEDAKLPDSYRASRRSMHDKPLTKNRPVLIKLRNELTTTIIPVPVTPETVTQPTATATSTMAALGLNSLAETPAPQINGHYRSLHRNSQNISQWLSEESVVVSAVHVTAAPPPAVSDSRPSYVVINRNNTSLY